jgi:hypothetical protein
VIRKVLGDLTSAGVECDEAPHPRGAGATRPSRRGRQLMEAGLMPHGPGATRSRRLIRGGIPDARGARSPTLPATATIMRPAWSPRASGGCRVVQQPGASTRPLAAGWAARSRAPAHHRTPD